MTDAYTMATGKTTLPAVGATKYNKLFSFAKILHRIWQNEPGVDWESLWQLSEVGTVSATDVFDVDDEVWAVSQRETDRIYVQTTAGSNVLYPLVSRSLLYSNRYSNAVSFNGTQLQFSKAFTATDQAFGGTIYLPVYLKLDEITSVTDDVLVDNPDWLSTAIAARYVMTDRQLNYLYPDLVAQQNELMTKMKENNERDDSTVGDTPFPSDQGGAYYAYHQ